MLDIIVGLLLAVTFILYVTLSIWKALQLKKETGQDLLEAKERIAELELLLTQYGAAWDKEAKQRDNALNQLDDARRKGNSLGRFRDAIQKAIDGITPY